MRSPRQTAQSPPRRVGRGRRGVPIIGLAFYPMYPCIHKAALRRCLGYGRWLVGIAALHLLVLTVSSWFNGRQLVAIEYLRTENRVLREQSWTHVVEVTRTALLFVAQGRWASRRLSPGTPR